MVTDYQTHFLALVNRYKELSEPHQINIFTFGLCDPLKTDVELEQLTTLEEAMALARTYEQRLAMTIDTNTRSSSCPTFSHTAIVPSHSTARHHTANQV
jgi:hypothetical protein